MKQKLMALFLVILMVASAFTALSLTATPVAAATTTTTKITASTTNPTVGQTVAFTVTLKAGTKPLYRPVTIWHYLNFQRYEDGTHYTSLGLYSFTKTFATTGQRVYYVKFAGDNSYASSQSTLTVTVKYGTTLSPTSAVTPYRSVGQTYTLSGYLNDQYGKPLTGKKIQFYWRTGTSGTWQTGSSVYTSSTGLYSNYGLADHPTTIQYQARYAGDSTHGGASSAIWTVKWKYESQLSLYSSSVQAPVQGWIYFYGNLKDQNGNPLEDKLVTLYWRNSPSQSWIKATMYFYTGSYGSYMFRVGHAQPETVYWITFYAGDSTHWPAQSNVVAVRWA